MMADHFSPEWYVPNCEHPIKKSTDAVPGPRAAHSCNLIGNKLYVFGGWNGRVGLNDLHVLDTETLEWRTPNCRGEAPSNRNNHATFVHNSKLYVHGGHNHELGWLNDMHTLDTCVNPSGVLARSSSATSGTLHHSSRLPFSVGLSGSRESRQVEASRLASSVGCHESRHALHGHGYGPGLEGEGGSGSTSTLRDAEGAPEHMGMQASDAGSTGGAWPGSAFHAAHMHAAWPQLSSHRGLGVGAFMAGSAEGGMTVASPSSPCPPHPPPEPVMQWSMPTLTGTCPSARACHTLTLVGRKVFCFGGYDGSRCFSDVDVLDLDTHSWLQPRVQGTVPCPRNAQTVTVVGGTRLFLFGGHSGNTHLRDMHVLDTETLTWSQPDTCGAPPPGLRGHTANLVGGPSGKIVMFGGFDGRGRSNSLYILDTISLRWEQDVRAQCAGGTSEGTPAGRQRHTAVLVNNRSLFVIGGFNGGVWLSDVHVLDVSRLLYNLASTSVSAAGQDGLLSSLRELVNNPSAFPDVVFTVEGSPVYAHRALLSGRCAHYRAMFGGRFREGAVEGVGATLARTVLAMPLQDPIPVPKWSRASFLAMLEFVYTGAVSDLGPDTAVDALGLADAVGLPGLAALATSVLHHAVDGNNVCTVLAAAHSYGSAELKAQCLDFLLASGDGVDLGPLEAVPGLLLEITRQLLRAQRSRV